MKIYIHYKIIDKPWGGSNSFLKAFRDYLLKNKTDKVTLSAKLQDKYDLLFIISNTCGLGKKTNYKKIRKLSEKENKSGLGKLFQQHKCKIIHRVDGLRSIYTDDNSFYEGDMEQFRLSLLANWIIFQSKNSLGCFKKIGYSGRNYSIIYNGANQNIFNCNNRSWWNNKTTLKVFSNSWSSNRKKGFDIISRVSKLKGVESIFVGNWCKEVDPANVKIIPPLKQEGLSSYYKDSDVFLFPSINEACPNVLLEALSCGLPVIYHNSGGTPELASKYGIALPEDISADSLRKTLEELKNNYHQLVNNINRDMKKFSIDYAAEQYLRVFEEVLNENR